MYFSQRISIFWGNFSSNAGYAISIVLSVIAFAVLYYYIIKFLVGNNAGQIVAIFSTIMIIAGGVFIFNSSVDGGLFLLVPVIYVILIFVLYSVELKRLIWSRKNMKLMEVKHGERSFYDEEKIQNCTNEIIKAVQDMSKNDVGAIIVLSSGNVPEQVLESGVVLESDISSELIESVFFPKTPLHDGAMIINGTKIMAAGCFLPLSQNNDKIPKDLGTRHRAGLGVTETIDVVSIIVSEETGIISIAKEGKITRYADTEMLRKTLNRYYWQELDVFKK